MNQDQFEQTVSQELKESEQRETFESIWKTLSRVDVSDKIETKGSGSYQLKYLSWAWAWGVLMEKYPNSTYKFNPPVDYTDGTCEVWVTLNVAGNKREMWLPVMDHKNQSIKNPTSRDISDTRMRCLVKCLAMFGLGHYIYAGEDLPVQNKADSESVAEIKRMILEAGSSIDAVCAFYKVGSLDDMSEKVAEDCINKLARRIEENLKGRKK